MCIVVEVVGRSATASFMGVAVVDTWQSLIVQSKGNSQLISQTGSVLGLAGVCYLNVYVCSLRKV